MLGLVLFEGPVCGPVDVPLPPLVYGLYIATQLYGTQSLEPEQFTSAMRGRCLSVEDQLNFVSEFKPANWTQIRYDKNFRAVAYRGTRCWSFGTNRFRSHKQKSLDARMQFPQLL